MSMKWTDQEKAADRRGYPVFDSDFETTGAAILNLALGVLVVVITVLVVLSWCGAPTP